MATASRARRLHGDGGLLQLKHGAQAGGCAPGQLLHVGADHVQPPVAGTGAEAGHQPPRTERQPRRVGEAGGERFVVDVQDLDRPAGELGEDRGATLGVQQRGDGRVDRGVVLGDTCADPGRC